MEKQKNVLYYVEKEKLSNFYGEPVYLYTFKDLETMSKVYLAQSYYRKEVQYIKGFLTYEDILDAKYDFNIIWDVNNYSISPIKESFEYTKLKYELYKTTCKDSDEVYNKIMSSYISNKKLKVKIK